MSTVSILRNHALRPYLNREVNRTRTGPVQLKIRAAGGFGELGEARGAFRSGVAARLY